MLIAVRHARTNYNEDGNEKLRGWLSIPLSDEGMREAIQTGKELKKYNMPIDSFSSSPIKRAVQTATEISDEIGKEFETSNGLKDWNTGELTGQPVDRTLPLIHDYIDHPNDKIPKGESFNQFYNRVFPFLKNKIEDDDIHLIVTHNRIMTLLKALCENKGSSPAKYVLKNKGPVEPSGIVVVEPNWKMTTVYNPISSREVSNV